MSRGSKVESRKPDSHSALDPRPSTLDHIYALAFGLFLGLCIWKFGNPVILDSKITSPNSPAEFWNYSWPTHWGNWILLPLAIVGVILAIVKKSRRPTTNWLWLLPLLWFGWQFFSATQTVDAVLTSTTLWQFFGCVACYFLGAFLFGSRHALNFLLIGILAAFTFCLVRAVDQRIFEFPQSRQMLLQDESENWTNVSAEMLLQMKQGGSVITTNGVDVANPVILAKFANGRVSGTLVYPNALAGLVLLLFPTALVLAFNSTKQLRPVIRTVVIALTIFLGGAGFFWTGSKLGWLVAIATGAVCLFRLNWSTRLKFAALGLFVFFGLGIFAVRFQNYFSAGATSARGWFYFFGGGISR